MRSPFLLAALAACLAVAAPAAGQGQYKRVHQKALMKITSGEPAAAVTDLRAFLEKHPQDAETYYVLAVAQTRLGDLEAAAANLKQAIMMGLPDGRFAGGTKMGLEPLRKQPEMKQVIARFQHEPVHGPMLGDLTDEGIRVWVRTAEEADVAVVVTHSKAEVGKSKTIRTKADDDYTAVIPVTGLKPATEYSYRLLVGGKPSKDTHTFRTLLARDKQAKFTIGFGGGAGYVPQHEHMWATIHAEKPHALLLLGDNVYIDRPQSPEMQHYCYYRRQSRPSFRKLVASCPVYAIWDDHDFGTNDCSGGPALDRPAWKRPVWEVFRNNWVNPYYGGGDANPGCWYDFYLADVHFIMLDGRYYRTRSKGGDGVSTMLGPVQKKWLLDTLARSKGTFKVLCSPVPWTFSAKGNSPDTWNGFQKERSEIFDFLSKSKIEGVVLMSADRHRSDLWKIEREKGYALYEFNSSRLTNQHVHGTMKAAEFSYNKKQSFGLVDFDSTAADPTVTYRIKTIDGEEVFKFSLKRSQLK